jgi:hypothetical protein
MITKYFKVIFFLVASSYASAQILHHQMISSQGINVKLVNGILINQSIGQLSVVGNFTTPKGIVGQGYIQSLKVSPKHQKVKPTISVATYPNPFIDEIHFKFPYPVNDVVRASLFDTRGRLIFIQEKVPVQDVLTFNDLHFLGGTYFVKLELKNFIYSTQIIKTR